MTATLAKFRERFPTFDSTEDSVVELALEEALMIHAVRPLATLYCAAHLVELLRLTNDGQAPPGETLFMRAGSFFTQFKTQASEGPDVFFTRTEYGRHFLILEKRSPRRAIGAIVV